MILANHLRQTSPWLNDIDRLFDLAFSRTAGAGPDFRVLRDEQGWTLELDLPGVSRENLGLEVRDEHLRLSVQRDGDEDTAYRLPLGRQVDRAGVTAKLDLGVLRVRLPRVDADQNTKTIEIH